VRAEGLVVARQADDDRVGAGGDAHDGAFVTGDGASGEDEAVAATEMEGDLAGKEAIKVPRLSRPARR